MSPGYIAHDLDSLVQAKQDPEDPGHTVGYGDVYMQWQAQLRFISVVHVHLARPPDHFQVAERKSFEMRCFLLLVVGAIMAPTGTYGSGLFENLVTFGDSYTDDGRLAYYIENDGSAPPPGVLPPQSSVSASGGLAWGQFVQRDTGAAYFDYAVSGATCSNEIVSRLLGAINKPFPSVVDDELPSFVADVGVQALYENRTSENTVYALWIGTNDLGIDGFLTDSQAPGVSEPSYHLAGVGGD